MEKTLKVHCVIIFSQNKSLYFTEEMFYSWEILKKLTNNHVILKSSCFIRFSIAKCLQRFAVAKTQFSACIWSLGEFYELVQKCYAVYL